MDKAREIAHKTVYYCFYSGSSEKGHNTACNVLTAEIQAALDEAANLTPEGMSYEYDRLFKEKEAAEAKLARAREILESALDAFEGLAAYENTNPWCEEIRNFLAELQEGGGAVDSAREGVLPRDVTPAVADAEAAPPVSPIDPTVLKAGLDHFGPSHDGAVERDLKAAPPCPVCGGEKVLARIEVNTKGSDAVAKLHGWEPCPICGGKRHKPATGD